MKSGGQIYYVASALAMIAVFITIVKGGFTSNEYFHVGFLTLMAIVMVWLGRKQRAKLVE